MFLEASECGFYTEIVQFVKDLRQSASPLNIPRRRPEHPLQDSHTEDAIFQIYAYLKGKFTEAAFHEVVSTVERSLHYK